MGHYECAVDCAIKAKRFTEAILIANMKNDVSLMEQAIQSWFDSQSDNYLQKTFKQIVKNDISVMGAEVDLDHWQDGIISYFFND